ncbi:MAG: sulfoxide reductase heme-binding subunit YedZ [Deltaproteobacteria bacterium]|nr:MAG: sulfoxide reductase heme-binding subunit YedZ [Deltaproteobacteria bacterium]
MKRWLVPAAFAACLLPLAWLVVRFLRDDLGANPIAEVLNRLGLDAFVLLVLTLACTPAQILFKVNWPIRIRKLLGDFCFFYACLHLLTYAGLDQGLAFGEIGRDIVKRPFITLGVTTWVLLLPLAVTSTQGWQRRLGYRRWKGLHRLVYLAGVLACVHFLWRFKTALFEPLLWSGVVALLLGIRIVSRLRLQSR